MPAILGPTNPVPGQEPPQVRITTPQAGDTSVQNIVNPQQVTRPDNRTDQQDHGDATQSQAARYESNFMTFVQRLRNSPDLAQSFLSVIQGSSLQVSSGIRAGFADEISQFMEFLQMDESQLLSFLQNQVQSGSRFSGPLFQAMRNAFPTASDLTRTDILQTLKKFSDWSSTAHLESRLVHTMEDMADSLPSRWATQLIDLTARLENGIAAGRTAQTQDGAEPRQENGPVFSALRQDDAPLARSDRQGNLKLLRDQVFPLISDYVGLTHNHGRARALLSVLALDVARYENGSEEGLLASVRHLAANGVLPEGLSKLPDKELMRLLRTSTYFREGEKNTFADRLSELTDRALQGEGGVNSQDAFRNILSAMLINESVYMPLTHVMLPIQFDDRLMFSEMWVDPDADSDSRTLSPEGTNTVRILLKLDVQNVGAFDLLINAKGEDVQLQAACPPAVAAFSGPVTQALTGILERSGFHADVAVGQMRRPVTVSEIFPKIFEKASGVNVAV